MNRSGFYSGSFDPVSFGHLDVIERAARVLGRVVVGVGVHHGKTPLFSWRERVEMLQAETRVIAARSQTQIEVVTFDGLSVDAARAHRATVLVRGLRDATDFDYEMQMSGTNAAIAPDVETIFFAASPQHRHIASKFIRQIASMGGDVDQFVPPLAAQRLRAKLANQGQ
jgi:pantetheine-phosphate adenylyltransferase